MATQIEQQPIKTEEPLNLDFELEYKTQLKHLFSKQSLKFLLIPGKKDEKLSKMNYELNFYRTKRSILRRLKAPLTILGFFLLFTIITWAVFAPWISWYEFQDLVGVDMSRPAFQPPNEAHPLGTGDFGQDVYGRLIWGARLSLTLGLASVSISVVLGVIVGIISAYKGGWLDGLIMRVSDIIMSFPSMILVVLIVASSGRNIENILMIYGLLGIPGYARLMRGCVLQEKAKLYVDSAKVSGASELRLMFRHLLPNAIMPIIISVTFDFGGILLSLAGLSFLGFGATGVEWGYDIAVNKSKLINAPWCVIWPGVGIVLTVLGFMLVGDGLRDALDPRSKA
jgi:peptide/nickel transport system permease protein